MRYLLFLPLVFTLLLTPGCASLFSSSEYVVLVTSDPPGSTTIVRNKRGAPIQRSTTPFVMRLSASEGFFNPAKYEFDFQKDGYDPTYTFMSAHLDGWYIANILFGGLIGLLIIDPATGAMWSLDNRVMGQLSKTAPEPTQQHIQQTTPQPEGSHFDGIEERLRQLRRLIDEGLITEQEYTERRNAILMEI